MSVNLHSGIRDLTAIAKAVGGGMDCRPIWLCGHKHNEGIKRRMGPGLQPLMWRCANCVAEKAATLLNGSDRQ